MPQHRACLDVIEEGIVRGGYNGIFKEKKVFCDLALADTSKALIHAFFAHRSASKAIIELVSVGKTTKKVPDLVSRTFFPYAQSAHMLVNLGVDLFRIDKAIVNFGLPIGPFQLEDLSDYGAALAVAKEFAKAFGGRTFESPLVELMVKYGRNGKINGKGYYIYEKGRKPKPDPFVFPIIEECRRLTNIMPQGKPIDATDQEIVEMILFPVVNEACRVLDEGLVLRGSDLDVASVFGMSFPSYRVLHLQLLQNHACRK